MFWVDLNLELLQFGWLVVVCLLVYLSGIVSLVYCGFTGYVFEYCYVMVRLFCLVWMIVKLAICCWLLFVLFIWFSLLFWYLLLLFWLFVLIWVCFGYWFGCDYVSDLLCEFVGGCGWLLFWFMFVVDLFLIYALYVCDFLFACLWLVWLCYLRFVYAVCYVCCF